MPAGSESRHWGRGGRRVALVHCTLAHSGEWSGLARHLEARHPGAFSLVAADLPGHGARPIWQPADGDLHDLATAELRALIGAGPVDLVGHSFGGTVALRLALESPGLVRRLVLIEPVLFAAVVAGGAHPDNRPFEDAWARGDREETAQLFMERWGGGAAWAALPDRQRDYIRARIHLVPGQNAVIREDRPGLLAPGRLEALAAPVLLLHGGESPRAAGDIVARIAARLPRARVERIEGAGHMVPVSHPEELAARIGDFLTA